MSPFTPEVYIMVKRVFLILFFAFILLCAFTQYDGFAEVSDTSLIKQKVKEINLKTHTINAEFVQEKELSFLDEKIISKGIILYQKPDKLRLEYTSPYEYLIIINGKDLFINSQDSEINLNLESSSMFSEINDLIINSIQGNVMNMPNISTSFYENSELFLIQLIPEKEELKKYIHAIKLYISKNDYTVNEINIVELSGDYTLIKFINKEINEELPNGCFISN